MSSTTPAHRGCRDLVISECLSAPGCELRQLGDGECVSDLASVCPSQARDRIPPQDG